MRRTAFPILAALVALGALLPATAGSRSVSRRVHVVVAGVPERCEDDTYRVRVSLVSITGHRVRRGRLRVELDGRPVAVKAGARARFELDCSTLAYGQHELQVSGSTLDVTPTATAAPKRFTFVVAEPEV